MLAGEAILHNDEGGSEHSSDESNSLSDSIKESQPPVAEAEDKLSIEELKEGGSAIDKAIEKSESSSQYAIQQEIKDSSMETLVINYLNEGSYFGEIALIT